MNRITVVGPVPPAAVGQPMSAGRAARTVGRTPSWGRTLRKRWNADGPDGLADGRRGNGADPVLTPTQQAELYAALQAEPPNGGLWTGPKVARYVRDTWGIEVAPQTGWRWPVRLGRPEGLVLRVRPSRCGRWSGRGWRTRRSPPWRP